jgi:kynureninase
MAGADRAVGPARADAEAADAADPLAPFRDRFVHADDRIYLDGNSLGRLPLATRDRLQALAAEWGEQLVSGWPRWIDAPLTAGDAIAAVVGARPGEVLACDSTTVNLYKLAGAVIAARDPRALVVDRDEFPTDRHVMEGVASRHGLALAKVAGDPRFEPGALVVLSHVNYRTGALRDLAGLQAQADAAGATVIWDLSHSAGAVPVELHAAGARLAVGCTYKYLNAGPGAPGYLYVREDLQDGLRSPIQGWFGQADQFAMERDYEPHAGIRRFLAGTPPILGLAAVEEGAKITAEAGVAALHAKAVALTERLIALHDTWLAPLGFELGTPRDPALRGSHVALRHPEAWQITRALIERASVIPDFRGPDSVRLGVAPLYTRHVDVHDAVRRLRDLVALGAHREFDPTPGRVT